MKVRRPAVSSRRFLRRTSVLAGVLASLALAPAASAQDFGIGGASPSNGGIGPANARPDVANSPDSGYEPHQGRNSVKLFDQRRSIVSYQLDIGPIWHRRVEDEGPEERRKGFERGAPLASEIGIGTVYTTPARPFYLVGELKSLLRIVDDKSFSWAIFHQELGGGLMLGPFEPEVRLRLSVLSADIFHADPSLQLFSPGVAAGFGVHVGRIRVDLKAHAEYLWRWFGPDYLIRGVTLGFRFDLNRPKSPYPGGPQQ